MRRPLSRFKLIPLLLLAGVLSACGTAVTRMDPAQTKDLSGAWNDTDSRETSAAMVTDALSRQWLPDFTQQSRRRPTVIVGEIRNLSSEHINVNTFVSDIQRALINSDRVDFVASATERQEIRDERKDMDVNASEATRKAAGQESGADFMLKGTINTIIDVSGSTQVRYYQVDLNLISLKDNRIVWVGQKKIKKLVERSNLRF
jgi:uncharacterized protein (TIGR02722 family)